MQGKENRNPNHRPKHAKNTSLFNNPLIAQQLSPPTGPHCHQHRLSIGTIFCEDCLRYDLCSLCAKEQHQGHKIRHFGSFEEAKEQTKELLLNTLEDTLNSLKGRENELKNNMEGVSLTKDKIKAWTNEIADSLRDMARTLEEKIKERLDGECMRYERELDDFYAEYNKVNDHLREGLLKIIDNEVDMVGFSRKKVEIQMSAGSMPDFGRIRGVMEKGKQYLRGVKQAIAQLQTAVIHFTPQEQQLTSRMTKYDRFLTRDNASQDHQPALLRTLPLLEGGGGLQAIRNKLRG